MALGSLGSWQAAKLTKVTLTPFDKWSGLPLAFPLWYAVLG